MTDTPPHSVPYVPGRLGQAPLAADSPATDPGGDAYSPVPAAETTGAIPAPMAQPARPQRNGPLVLVLAVGLVLAVAAGVVGFLLLSNGKTPLDAVKAATGPSPYRITGSVSLSRGYDGSTTPCGGTGGYKDIRSGAQVVISDSTGSTIAIGRLEAGTVTSGRGCVLPFAIPDVPAGKGFYGIEVTHRGVLRYDEAEFSTRELELTLG